VCRVVEKTIIDDLPSGVDNAEAAAAGAAVAGLLEEYDAFAIEGYGGAGVDEGEFGAELLGMALVLFDVAGAGRGLGLGVFGGWLGGGLGGVDIGVGSRRDYWAAVDPGALVCGYGRDMHEGCSID
jgi:hypothetical protein